MNDSLRTHVEMIKKLPTLPVIAQEILSLIDDNMVSVGKLVNIIENDPAISAKILSVAGSVFFGLREPPKTLVNAIMRIGFESVKNIALGISVMTMMGGLKHQDALDYRRIFNHCVAVGLIAKLLSGHFNLDIKDEILTCGLLHDIGLLVMSRYFPVRYLNVLDILGNEKSIPDAERETFAFTHAEIGSWLVEKWNLSDPVFDTVLYHHNPSLADNNVMHVAAVHIADYIVTLHILRPLLQEHHVIFNPSSLDILGISEQDLNNIVTGIKDGSLFNGLFIS